MSGNVLRLQPPLTISTAHLRDGFARVEAAIDEVLAGYEPAPIPFVPAGMGSRAGRVIK